MGLLGLIVSVVLALPRPVQAERPSAPPILLMFHAGGFIFDCSTPCLAWAAGVAAQYGFEPRDINYPLGSVPAAMAAARQAVPAHRRAFAYGESAGGLLAARLAQMGCVEAAAVHSPVSNLPFYLSWLAQETGDHTIGARLQLPTLTDQRKFSPAFHRTRHPVFVAAAADDALTPATMAWVQKQRPVRGVVVPGDHLDSSRALYPERVRLLLRWLDRRVRKPVRHRAACREGRAGRAQRGSRTTTGIIRSHRRW
jgi:acetyl esterase/lipase